MGNRRKMPGKSTRKTIFVTRFLASLLVVALLAPGPAMSQAADERVTATFGRRIEGLRELGRA